MLSFIYGRKVLQSFFNKLFSLSVKGLNYGIVGSGEKWVMDYIWKSSGGRHLVLFDVGANIGSYTLDLLSVFGDKVSIYAFEPMDTTFQSLTKNVQEPKVVLQAFGFGNKNEQVPFYYHEEAHTLASVHKRDLVSSLGQKTVQVELRTLDSFCHEKDINQIDFIKIDTEGNEYACLEGAKDLLARKAIKFIQFEFGESSIDAGSSFKMFWTLLNKNYRIYRILKDGLEEVKKYHVRHELYYYCNFLAELKV